MPADLILYALVAVVLVFWLRNTLGTRHGEERQRDNPLNGQENAPRRNQAIDRGKVIDITDIQSESDNDIKRFPGIDILPEAAAGLMEIIRYDRNFDPYRFIQGARDAFPMIVEAFAEGDTDTLQDLLAPKVFRAFADVIDARKIRGETVATEIHAVRKAEIVEARLVGKIAYISLRLTADETCVIRDGEGQILSGHPDRVTELRDIWTFGRDISGREPTWLVYETRDDVAESEKTPIPDSDGRH